jgi:hypothetical protein
VFSRVTRARSNRYEWKKVHQLTSTDKPVEHTRFNKIMAPGFAQARLDEIEDVIEFCCPSFMNKARKSLCREESRVQIILSSFIPSAGHSRRAGFTGRALILSKVAFTHFHTGFEYIYSCWTTLLLIAIVLIMANALIFQMQQMPTMIPLVTILIDHWFLCRYLFSATTKILLRSKYPSLNQHPWVLKLLFLQATVHSWWFAR